jgi:hypothetical protein
MDRRRFIGAAAAAAFLSLVAGCATTAAANAPAKSPIIAVGDIHGDWEAWTDILRKAGLIDARTRWIGGSAILVQTGDIPDRGPDTKRIIEHLMALEKEAKRKGGAVIALIGNHEALNVIGDLRYVTPAEYAAFRNRDSTRRRNDLFARNRESLAAQYRAKTPGLDDAGVRRAFEEEFPLGWVEHRLAWAPNGSIGAWVASHDAIRVIGDTLFVHGGISAAYAARPIAAINAEVRAAIKAAGGPILEDEEGPLWHRRLASETPEGRADLEAALAAYGVSRIVIGHTPSLSGVRSLYGGRVIMIDTGASAAYGGKRAFLRIDGGRLIANNDGVSVELGGATP